MESLRDDHVLHQRGLEVVDILGVGGRSVVYHARELRHDRDVAAKVRRADPAMDHAGERFERAVQIAASVRHMHVLPLFDSGVLADRRRFAVMPVAQGRPMRALLDEGALAPADATRLARDALIAWAVAVDPVHRLPLLLALAAGVWGMVARASRLFDPNHVSADLVLATRRNTFAHRTESGLTRHAMALAESSRAGILASGRYFRDGDSLAVVAEVSDTRSGRVVGIVGPERMSPRHAEGSLARMAERVATSCVVDTILRLGAWW